MQPAKEEEEKKQELDGYISVIYVNGKRYGLKAAIVEVYPTTCPKCGGSFELKYGHGKCDFCNTYYSTEFKLVETKG